MGKSLGTDYQKKLILSPTWYVIDKRASRRCLFVVLPGPWYMNKRDYFISVIKDFPLMCVSLTKCILLPVCVYKNADLSIPFFFVLVFSE